MTSKWPVCLLVAVACALLVASCAPRGRTVDMKRERPGRGAGASGREAAPSGQAENLITTEKFTYYCPTHPEVTQDAPGVCPKDGKFLVAKASAGAKVEYVCPVHTNVVRDQPGKCPKCERLLEARTVKPAP